MSSATRHCLLPGLYPVRSGAYPNHTRLNDGVGTLPQYLKQAGYRVALEEGNGNRSPSKAFSVPNTSRTNSSAPSIPS